MSQVLEANSRPAAKSTCGRDLNFRIGVTNGMDVILSEVGSWPAISYVEVARFDAGVEAAPPEYLDVSRMRPHLCWRITLAEGRDKLDRLSMR